MQTYHFIGVGGIGMSALARILLQKGERVTGSDLASSGIIDQLKQQGGEIFLEHKADNITSSSVVIYSTDIAASNPEYQRAMELKVPLMHRSELLAELMRTQAPLLVTGTHGKTTTSSLLAHLLFSAGLDPTFAIGGLVKSLGSNGGLGKGPYFVAEADESDGSFLKLPVFGGIVTNMDNDHLNYWKTEEALLLGFKHFSDRVGSNDHFFWCADDKRLSSLQLGGVSYGFSEEADLCVNNFLQLGWKNYFDLAFQGKTYEEIEIPLIGAHNVLNAAAVFGMAIRLHISEDKIRAAFKSFEGVSRRAEKRAEVAEIAIYDDYAHHPTEIYATLRAIKRATEGRRLVVAFQPHRYTRTQDCMEQFNAAFEPADELILTDIYAAREAAIEGVTIDALLKKICKAGVHYVPRAQLASFLAGFLKKKDVLVTMGAGDITKVGPELLKCIKKDSP